MGCDYYTYTFLCVQFGDGTEKVKQVEKSPGYFLEYHLDEDDPEYERKRNEYEDVILNVRHEPIVLFQNGAYTNTDVEDRWKSTIDKIAGGKSVVLVTKKKEVERRW